MNDSQPSAKLHWAAKYVGMPYAPGGRGPEAVDCWGLLRMAYQDHFDIELPVYLNISLDPPNTRAAQVIKDAIKREWVEVQEPVDGCAVGMGHRLEVHHIGLYLEVDGGRVLHTLNRQLVIADTIRALRIRGMNVIKFYLHGLHH